MDHKLRHVGGTLAYTLTSGLQALKLTGFLLKGVTIMKPWMTSAVGFLLVGLLSGSGVLPKEGDELIGHQAPELPDLTWIHSEPLSLEELRGSVVLIRWWTAPVCPYCISSADALNEFDKTYSGKGLKVIGIYHPKPPSTPVNRVDVKAHAAQKGFTFPIGIDADWSALRSWWLRDDRRRWTSVSFILDRDGVIRYIHPGGEFHRKGGRHTPAVKEEDCVRAYHEIRETIEDLLGLAEEAR
jgi:peroxiredoxin